MSAPPAYPSAPSWPPSGYNPYSLDPAQILAAMQNNGLTTNIYDSTIKTTQAVNDAQRLNSDENAGTNRNIYTSTNQVVEQVNAVQRSLTGEIAGTNKNIYDSTNQVVGEVNAIQRLLTQEISGVNKNIYDTIAQNGIAIERTSANGMATTERVNAQLASAIERTSANGMSTTERVNSQLATAVERNGANNMAAVERNTGNITTAIERVAGEGRLTTTVTDAATRQASNDSARDILRAVDRVGSDGISTTKDTHTALLGSIERNAGEGRVQTLAAAGQTDAKLTDIRHSILNDVNRSASDILLSNTQNLNVLTKHVTDGAWEQRSAMAGGLQSISEQQLHSKHSLSQQSAQQYASHMLENQKLAAEAMRHHDNQFAAIISKTDSNFSTLLLEQQKVKECLAQQAAQQFAISQLEAQKVKEVITLQLQEAKYEALKSKNELSKEMAECCCDVKQKIDQRAQDVIGTVDTLDRNRLRDEINTTNNENNLLKFAEFGPWGYGGRGSRRNHHHHGRR